MRNPVFMNFQQIKKSSGQVWFTKRCKIQRNNFMRSTKELFSFNELFIYSTKELF